MVSDSLKSTLGPESLMGQRLVKNFALNIDGCSHAIQHYRESKSGITIKFDCNAEHLENILAKQSDADCLVCSGEKAYIIGHIDRKNNNKNIIIKNRNKIFKN